jgi:hypothetical protein
MKNIILIGLFSFALLLSSTKICKAQDVSYSAYSSTLSSAGLTEISQPAGWVPDTFWSGYSDVHFWQYGGPTGPLTICYVWASDTAAGYGTAGTYLFGGWEQHGSNPPDCSAPLHQFCTPSPSYFLNMDMRNIP